MLERMSFDLRECKFAQDGDAMTIAGYGAVFNNVDAGGDMIVPGAFAQSLAAHKAAGTSPLMLLEHGDAPLPIGVWEEMAEDGHGLRVKGRFLDTTMGVDAWKAAKAGAIGGLSIGYRATDYTLRSQPTDPRRTLKAVDLFEVSLVGVPMNGKARVTSVKSADLTTIRDFEEALVSGTLPPLSAKEAKALLSEGFKAIRPARDAGEEMAELAEIIRRNTAIFSR